MASGRWVSRVAQNIGLYGGVGSSIAGATGAIGAGTAATSALAKGGLAYVMSPVILSKMAQFSLKNKEIIKAASKKTIKAGESIKNARLIQMLISMGFWILTISYGQYNNYYHD